MIIEISPNTKFPAKTVPFGLTDGYDEANSRVSQFCGLAYRPATCCTQYMTKYLLRQQSQRFAETVRAYLSRETGKNMNTGDRQDVTWAQ
jgi:hypothetical protein